MWFSLVEQEITDWQSQRKEIKQSFFFSKLWDFNTKLHH